MSLVEYWDDMCGNMYCRQRGWISLLCTWREADTTGQEVNSYSLTMVVMNAPWSGNVYHNINLWLWYWEVIIVVAVKHEQIAGPRDFGWVCVWLNPPWWQLWRTLTADPGLTGWCWNHKCSEKQVKYLIMLAEGMFQHSFSFWLSTVVFCRCPN